MMWLEMLVLPFEERWERMVYVNISFALTMRCMIYFKREKEKVHVILTGLLVDISNGVKVMKF